MILDKVVDSINTTLKAGTLSGNAFQMGAFYGLARLITVIDGGRTTYPAVLSTDGKEVNVTVDERYPFSIYHRCKSIRVSSTTGGQDFGDGNHVKRYIHDMVAVAFSDMDRIPLLAEDLALFVADGLPSTIKVTGMNLSQFNLTINNINTDAQSVLSGEYQGVSKALNPRLALIAVSYTLETTLQNGCISCPDCN